VILEVAILDVRPGENSNFEVAFDKAQNIISNMEGYVSHQLQNCIDKPNRYILLVNWLTLKITQLVSGSLCNTKSGENYFIIFMNHFQK